MRGGTVKQFLKALDEMRTIYPFDDSKTQICTESVYTKSANALIIVTLDENTGINIEMSKHIPNEE